MDYAVSNTEAKREMTYLGRWRRYAVPLVVLFALVARWAFLQRLSLSPFLEPIAGGNDRALYHNLAQRMAEGAWMPPSVFEYMPLYPWVLGALYALFGPSLYVAGVAGILLDTATCFLIMRLALRYGATRWAAAAVGLAYAFYPVAVAYAPMTMSNTLNAFLVLAFVSLADGTGPSSSWGRWTALGLLAGMTTLGFAGMMPIFTVWAVWSGWRHRAQWRRGAPRMAVCVLAAIVPVIPVTVHNTRAEGPFVLITAHGGFNLFMGNHEGATGYPVQIEHFRGTSGSLLQDARREAETAAGHPLSAAEFSAYWTNRAKAFWRNHPGEALKLTGLKILKCWNRREYDDMRLLPMMRLTGTAFTAPFWPGYGVLAALALAGLFLVRNRVTLKGALLAGLFGLVLFFVTSRYRLAMVPLMAVLGALTLTRLGGDLADAACRRRRGPALRAAGVLALSAVFVGWPLKGADFRALDRYNTAAYLLAYGDAVSALAQTDAGLRIAPDDPSLLFARGNALFGLDHVPEAMAAYRKVLAKNPGHAEAHFNLGVCLHRMNDYPAAFSEVRRAMELDPQNPRFETWWAHQHSKTDPEEQP